MVIMKTSSRWLGVLGAAVIASAVGVSAYHDYSDSSTGCYDLWVGDGYCDSRNNNELCGYDGGDCCSCTCEKDVDYQCREDDFACIDPSAPCVDDDDVTVDLVENCDYVQGIGDGWCHMGNNNAGCGYDGGDCCSCTCVPPEDSGDDDYLCGDSDINPFACIDPNAACVNDDDVTVDIAENCYPGSIGNGYCDHYNNKAVCDYDGGDCCECTCVPDGGDGDDDFACTHNSGFACIDPAAECVDDDDITVDMVENCHDAKSIGNGWCDEGNNKPECNYDGGDCCECTCIAGEEFDDDYRCNELTGYACIDPAAPCVDDDGVTVEMLENCDNPLSIGNGWCDIGNNTPECNYDGGDCCECTCQFDGDSGNSNRCEEFYCIDPEAECVDDDDITVDMIDECYVFGIGDGYCNVENNNELCGWDGGDCCYCTCDSGDGDPWGCSPNTSVFNCKDESAPCFGEDPPTSTTMTDTLTYYPMSHEFDDDTTTMTDTDTFSMLYEFVPWEQDGSLPTDEGAVEPLPTVEGAVEVGTKTLVGVSATAHDVRPGRSSGMNGCGVEGDDGCEGPLTRDGITDDIESRWSCAPKLVEGGGPCRIEYTFAAPQHVMDIQVAFLKANERTRTLAVYFDGEMTHTHESYDGSTFNTIGATGHEVTTVVLEATGLTSNEWISLIEVLIFVQP
eukprot:g13565.t1